LVKKDKAIIFYKNKAVSPASEIALFQRKKAEKDRLSFPLSGVKKGPENKKR